MSRILYTIAVPEFYEKFCPIKRSDAVEVWQEEEIYQRRLEKARGRLMRCVCCGEIVDTERFLDLARFGLKAVGCERCVEKEMEWNS